MRDRVWSNPEIMIIDIGFLTFNFLITKWKEVLLEIERHTCILQVQNVLGAVKAYII